MTKFTHEEGMRNLNMLTALHVAYPQGKPVNVTVTMPDELWNVMAFCAQAILIANNVEDNDMVPDWFRDQIIDALNIIGEPNAEAVAQQTVEELIEEIQEEQK